MIEEQDVRDWEEYYRNVNAFNIPNADAKRVEIWDKAFLSTKTVRETLWEVYSKGFMDGVNDTSERFKSSAFRAKHDSELLDKVAKKFHGRIRLRELTRQETMDIFDDIIVEMKAEVKNE